MATTSTVTMFYIGNFADMDTDETDFDNENPNVVLGTHDDLAPTVIDEVDVNDDGVIHDDEIGSGDFLEYDLGGGLTSVSLDSSSLYNATILLGDGSTITPRVLVIQAANGDVFISEYPPEPIDGLSIQSITLDSLDTSNAQGINRGASNVENSSVVCFCTGTRIATPGGDRPVEDLRPGDLVTTLDHGNKPVVWVDRFFSTYPAGNAPIRISPNALGRGVPASTLRLSPQHRVILRSRIADKMYRSPEVLIAAKNLLELDGVSRSVGFLPVQYHHFACANHEIVFANGAEVETFFTGPNALRILGKVKDRDANIPAGPMSPARAFAQGAKARNLIRRHLKNRHAMQLV